MHINKFFNKDFSDLFPCNLFLSRSADAQHSVKRPAENPGSKMTKEKILEALSNVQEPDLGKDLVTLNMVKDIEINGNNISFTIVLTTPA